MGPDSCGAGIAKGKPKAAESGSQWLSFDTAAASRTDLLAWSSKLTDLQSLAVQLTLIEFGSLWSCCDQEICIHHCSSGSGDVRDDEAEFWRSR